MRRFLTTAAMLATATLVAACAGESQPAESTSGTTASLLSKVGANEVSGQPQLPQEGPQIDVALLGHNRGDGEALVRVVEMSDFGCGYCRQFHEESFPTLLAEYVESGMVEWKFMPFITGMFDNSLAVTEAAECAMAQSDELFIAMSDRLWSEQSTWKPSDDPAGVARGMADELGVNMREYDSCLEDDTRMTRIIASTQLAQQLGVRGTPTFFVVGYPPLQGALPLEMFQDVLTTAHAEASKGNAGG